MREKNTVVIRNSLPNNRLYTIFPLNDSREFMKRRRTQDFDEMNESMEQKDIEAKRELAKLFLKGDGVDKNEAKAVALLEECSTIGDPDAMLTLAKCIAFGQGVKQDAKLAESLITEAAKKGNVEAIKLAQLINDCKGQKPVYISRLVIACDSVQYVCSHCKQYTGFNKNLEWEDPYDGDESEKSQKYCGFVFVECSSTHFDHVGYLMNIVPIKTMRIRLSSIHLTLQEARVHREYLVMLLNFG